MDRIEIRRYRPGDEHALADVFFRSVRGVGPADYTAAQVEAWAPARPDPAGYVDRATDGRALLVAVTAEDRIVGYADLQDSGHVDHLYCLPDHVGQGIGALLYAAIEDEARSRGIDRLFVEASEAATAWSCTSTGWRSSSAPPDPAQATRTRRPWFGNDQLTRGCGTRWGLPGWRTRATGRRPRR